MSETATPSNKRTTLWWILLLAVVVFVWWYFRTNPTPGESLVVSADEASEFADPDDILVDFVDDLSPSQLATMEKQTGLDFVLVSDEADDEQFYRAHVDAASRDQILASLQKNSLVEIAEPDALYGFGDPVEENATPAPDDEAAWKGYPNDPKYKYQWHLDQIGMRKAWPLANGEGVIVAVLDTGVAYEDFQKMHMVPDLAGVRMVAPYNFIDNNQHAGDDHGHGTHVAGTIAQATNNEIGVAGVAPAVSIMPLKVLSASGSGSIAAIADAIRYAADKGAHVINMSLGGRFPSKVLEKAVAYAHKKGVVVVCAAGNDGKGKVGYPAAYAGSIAVAATQFDEKTTFYSNWGSAIDVAAPGGNTRLDQNGDGQPDGVLQNTIKIGDPTQDDYFAYMGTSMASPHVAGVAALIVSQGVKNPDQVEAILKDTSRKPTGFERTRYGSGIIDAPAAIAKSKSHQGASQTGIAVVLAAALLASRRRSLRSLGLGKVAVGLMVGAGGLFFIPNVMAAFGLATASSGLVSLAAHGLPSWDLNLLGLSGHGNVLFFSALVPFALIALLSGKESLKPWLFGLATGVCGHLLFFAVAPMFDISYMGFDRIWLLLNAAILAGMAWMLLGRRSTLAGTRG